MLFCYSEGTLLLFLSVPQYYFTGLGLVERNNEWLHHLVIDDRATHPLESIGYYVLILHNLESKLHDEF